MQIENIIPLVFSGFALAVSIHNAWFTRKQFKLNSLAREAEENRKKKAKLIAKCRKTGPSRHQIDIVNIGESAARNIVCDFDNSSFGRIHISQAPQFPFSSLETGESIHLVINSIAGSDKSPHFNIMWNDDFKEGNMKMLTVSIS